MSDRFSNADTKDKMSLFTGPSNNSGNTNVRRH